MISWENITFSYEGQEAGGLNQINLTILPGECVLFCGRSGCGKTTMLRLINGLIPEFFSGEMKGTVSLENQDISQLAMYQLAGRVGSVFQNPRTQFFNVDTDGEIAFGIENQALPPKELRQRLEQTTEDLHIQNLRGRNIFELSGGEKQKIAFASVYAMNPEVYLLDEPSSNLDMSAIEELREHLAWIKKQGKTILIAEHRLYYLMDLADRIVYLDQGRICGIYTPEEFLQIPDGERVAMGLRTADLSRVHPYQISERKMSIRKMSEDTMMEGIPALELRDVTLRYQKQAIVSQASLKAFRGEIVAVAGHNGAGKTTFSRALCGLHKGCEGQFLWEGRPMEPKERCKRSYLVMQDVGYQLFAESVEKECVFGLKNPDEKLALQTLEDLGLADFRKRHPNTLSGGQKQRLAVAVSMMSGKDILVFDEPTSGLDLEGMTQVAVLLERLAAQGKVIFVVTHDYELVCRACSRVLSFGEGRLAGDWPVTAEKEEIIRGLFGLDSLLEEKQFGK